jgi:hypothetical protein
MTGQTLILSGPVSRERGKRLIDQAPQGAVVNIRKANRSSDQNALMWALLSDVSRSKPEGRELTPEVWKALFMAALGHAVRFETGLDGDGVVPVGFRSSRLTKQQMSDLIEVIQEYGARHGVVWTKED